MIVGDRECHDILTEMRASLSVSSAATLPELARDCMQVQHGTALSQMS